MYGTDQLGVSKVIKKTKVRSEIKETTFCDGNFRTLSGHSVANYICIFHKTEVLTVILMCLLSLNLNWIKSYDINSNVFWQLFVSILEEKKVSKIAIFNHFWSFLGNYVDTFHKTEIQTVILRYLVCLYLNWMTLKSYFNAWRCIISVIKYQSKFWHLRKKPAGIFSIWLFFQKFF